ncbi:AraC family transcriptional regulator [Streptomyces sp. BR123]|uniref:AraC family transcriptional regulator n=1 Tax=Streptomyces sp. BR123 TaxID=2749828 RepID=UPI0015C4CA63|nr:AraC family transcriptional regulator [Streptomyces sp. BR123]NXY94213.1 AraC family transcriptional regulator [Streptomyces sp. BR123]
MSLDEFRDLLGRHARADLSTAIDGVRICRADRDAEPEYVMSGVMLAVIAQGAKRLALGHRVYDYGVGQYLVASADLPVVGRVAQGPELGFGMTLEPSVIAELMLQAGPGDLPLSTRTTRPGITVSEAPAELIDAIVRLLRLLDRPRDRRVLVPLIKREILWLLMTGEQGEAVRQLGLADSSLTHITRAVGWIRDNYAETFRVDDLAQSSGMSVSAFYRNFQSVTAMSPIRFQKQIRLQAARLLLANRPHDVTGVASRVGYDSPSQFSREYKRQFGMPPRADAARMRGLADQVTASVV